MTSASTGSTCSGTRWVGSSRCTRCSTTVLIGEGDTGLRPSAELMAERIDGAELVVLPGGHCPQEDDPAPWQAAVQAHLSRVG